MPDGSFLDLPFFEPRHRDVATLAREVVRRWIEAKAEEADSGDVDRAGREFLRVLGRQGLLALLGPNTGSNGPSGPDLRSLCVAREILAAASAVADSVFAVQGLALQPILRAGSDALRQRYLPRGLGGESIGAFALTEPDAGSDLAGIRTTARRDGAAYVLDGVKTLISNAGIADFFVVFAVVDHAPEEGRRPLSGFVVDADTPGVGVAPLAMLAPHPIGEVRFDGAVVSDDRRLGPEGEGMALALGTLDLFRPSVGAAACGLASRALAEAIGFTDSRRQFGSRLADFQATRFALAEMQTELDAARLLVYRAAWLKDREPSGRISQEGSIAKLFATEAAQRIVDRAVQLHGGAGVRRGVVVERLYREVRALRIYEGTSEIQRLIIAKSMLADRRTPRL
jgi:acyl-CoA dehydrogenase